MTPICSWCHGGTGRRYSKTEDLVFYYVCNKCIGDFTNDFDVKDIRTIQKEDLAFLLGAAERYVRATISKQLRDKMKALKEAYPLE